MLFTSYEFLGFLTLVILLYYLIPKRHQWHFLLLASIFFYYQANPIYLLYLAATTLSTWICAVMLQRKKDCFAWEYEQKKEAWNRQERKEEKERQKKRELHCLLAGIFLPIGILAVVKYTNFTIYNINSLLQVFGQEQRLSFCNMLVPLGISFYTFQSVGYLIDVYREKYPAERSFFKTALFLSFFPQLIQGPISRFDDMAKSLYEEHKAEFRTIVFGMQRILWGFFKKLVVADRILVAVQCIIGDTQTYRGAFVWLGMFFYALELYADFTGGIDITIGIAQTLGIKVRENFERPYFSKNIKEYWKRWHISMGSWFTDYLFYPISLSRPVTKLSKFTKKHFGNAIGKRVPVYLSAFIVWFTTGIWHGASWNFVAWGLANFAVIMFSQELDGCYRSFHARFALRGKKGYQLVQVIRTFVLMSMLRMFDCYRDVSTTCAMYVSMFKDFSLCSFHQNTLAELGLSGSDVCILVCSVVLMTSVSLLQRSGSVREKIAARSLPVQLLLWYLLLLAVLLFGRYGAGYESSQFIYHQF